MANRFTRGDIEKIREVKALLDCRIVWAEDWGGLEAKAASEAIDEFLKSPGGDPDVFCRECGKKK